MSSDYMLQMKSEVNCFKLWAEKTDRSYGEWETDYDDWYKIYNVTEKLIKNVPVEQWNGKIVEEFLYILARDNEVENIIEQLIERPHQLLSLAKLAVSYKDPDAKWQIAYGLGEINGEDSAIKSLLSEFLRDECEYVRRRALFALRKRN
ncbi:HEAT repeat domain-containing protein [Priestia abyssalis]|uniref:HEAT repeat domain-containing protein n=1 Tax=Priestia abyssalis TaxID=1221450 RepID=UPI000994FA5E|nr:HEAT repeat domain-containing protein [Priestia abyssalis]